MKKLVHLKKARYLAIFLAVLCGTVGIASAFMLYFTVSLGLYDKKWTEIKNKCYERVQTLYSMKVFEEREDNPDCLNGTNFEYGILEGDKYSATDFESAVSQINLSDSSSYLYQNFRETIPDQYTLVKEFHECDIPEYNLGLFGSLLNSGHVYQQGYNKEYEERVVAVCYNRTNGIFYYQTTNFCVPIQNISVGKNDEAVNYYLDELEELEGRKKYVREDGVKTLDTARYRNWEKIYFDFNEFDIDKIRSITSEELEQFSGSESIVDYTTNASLDDGLSMSIEIYTDDPGSVYWIISNVKEPLDESTDDLFVQQIKLIRLLYLFRYASIVITVVSMLLCIVLFVFCCKNIGYEAREQNIQKKLYYRLPLVIYLAVMGFLFIVDMSLGEYGIDFLVNATKGTLPVLLVALIFIAAIGVFLILLTLINLSCRYQTKILWKNTILYHILKGLSHFFEELRQNTSLIIRAGLIWGAISILEFLVIVVTSYRVDMELCLFFVYKVAEAFFVYKVLLQMKKLQEGSRQMAQGDLESKIDTNKMQWEFKRHGEFLNQIGDGMSIALQDRMKSERFKTELITNVSHDIKTPLTSIINYIDLMKREQISEPVVQEYLGVLDHQSARLKKLIEDLMEASKASTGNLTVNWEPCDMDILLAQVLGEFEERMERAQLDLVISKQEESVYIMADNRHLWRIFENLMNNVCKYAQPGTRVYINQEVEQEMVNIIFRNTSKYPLNITSEELLERFVRGDASRNTEGSGLGLSIARNLAELMNGVLELYVDGDLFKVILRFPQKK